MLEKGITKNLDENCLYDLAFRRLFWELFLAAFILSR